MLLSNNLTSSYEVLIIYYHLDSNTSTKLINIWIVSISYGNTMYIRHKKHYETI